MLVRKLLPTPLGCITRTITGNILLLDSTATIFITFRYLWGKTLLLRVINVKIDKIFQNPAEGIGVDRPTLTHTFLTGRNSSLIDFATTTVVALEDRSGSFAWVQRILAKLLTLDSLLLFFFY